MLCARIENTTKQNTSLEGELVRNVWTWGETQAAHGALGRRAVWACEAKTRKRLAGKPSTRLVRMPPLLKAEGGRSQTRLEKKKGFSSPGHKWEGKHKFGAKLIFYPKDGTAQLLFLSRNLYGSTAEEKLIIKMYFEHKGTISNEGKTPQESQQQSRIHLRDSSNYTYLKWPWEEEKN